MNIKGALSSIGGKLSDIGGDIAAGAATGARHLDSVGTRSANIAAAAMGDSVLVRSTRASAKAGTGFVTDMVSPTAKRTIAGVGGGAEGLLAGAAGGAVVGGVAGGIDEDETFLGGAAKGALIGGGIGGVGGAASGALHMDPRVIANTMSDLSVAKDTMVGLGKDGIGLVKSKLGR